MRDIKDPALLETRFSGKSEKESISPSLYPVNFKSNDQLKKNRPTPLQPRKPFLATKEPSSIAHRASSRLERSNDENNIRLAKAIRSPLCRSIVPMNLLINNLNTALTAGNKSDAIAMRSCAYVETRHGKTQGLRSRAEGTSG